MVFLMAILFVFCSVVWSMAMLVAFTAMNESEYWFALGFFGIAILSGGTCFWIIWKGIQALIMHFACGG